MNQQAARQTRQAPLKKQSGYMSSLGSNRIRSFVAGAALSGTTPNPDLLPQAPEPITSSYSAPETEEQESAAPEYSAVGMENIDPGEAYQRAFRQRRIQHQIGQSVGLLSNRGTTQEEPDELELLEQEYAQREADLLANNQLGIDQRSSAAKRATQMALKESGLQEAAQQIVNEAGKEIGAFTVNFAAGTGEVADTAPADFGLTEFLTFIQNILQVVRTILSPAPPAIEEAEDIHQLMDNIKKQTQEAALDLFISRVKLHTPSGLTAFIKIFAQGFVISLIVIVLCMFLAFMMYILYTIYSFVDSPISSIIGFLRYQIGI